MNNYLIKLINLIHASYSVQEYETIYAMNRQENYITIFKMRINIENICIRKTKLAPTKLHSLFFQDIFFSNSYFIYCMYKNFIFKTKKNHFIFW